MQYQGIEEQKIVNRGILPLARELNLPLVATNDVHYLRQGDHQPHDILLCIGTGKTVNDAQRLRYTGDQFFLKTAEQMAHVFADHPDALRNTLRDRRALQRHDPEGAEPPADSSACRTASRSTATSSTSRATASRSGCRGCASSRTRGRLRHTIDEYERRLEYEIEMIKKMGFPGYLLIVWDFIRYAREERIPVGPGRGSAAGIARGVVHAHHRRRSDRLRSDLRALPQSRAHLDARHRRRLLRAAARRGDRLRHAQVRPRERRADHHLRDDEGEGGGPRRRPRARHAVRGRRSHREADSRRRST